MPTITLEGPALTREQKKELIKGFTEVAVKAMPNIPNQAFVVIIKENPNDNVGVGGKMVSDIHKS